MSNGIESFKDQIDTWILDPEVKKTFARVTEGLSFHHKCQVEALDTLRRYYAAILNDAPYSTKEGVSKDVLLNEIRRVVDSVPKIDQRNQAELAKFADTLVDLVNLLKHRVTFPAEAVVAIDDLRMGFGVLIVRGFADLSAARAWGEKFQAREGDYPLWNAFTPKTGGPILTVSVRSDPANPHRSGPWMRRIYRKGGMSNTTAAANLIGPFTNSDYLKGYGARDEVARDSTEWQEVKFDLKIGPRSIYYKDMDLILDKGRYFASGPTCSNEFGTAAFDLILAHSSLLSTSAASLERDSVTTEVNSCGKVSTM